MGKGLAQALLITSREAFRGAAPIDKVTTPGFLQYLLGNNKPRIISVGKDDGSGYMRDVKIRYRTRGVPGKTVTDDDCSVQVKPVYAETSVPATSFRALGLAFEDDQIATFERDALAQVSAGTPQMTGIMKDIWEGITEQLNGFFADINNDLLAAQVANFGVNIVPGNNAARTVNFELSTANNTLDAGMTRVMADAMANEMKLNGSTIVGSGLVNNYYLQQVAKGNAQNGVNTSQLALPSFYFDPYAQTAWGANQFGLFEKDAVQFVNTCRFRGAKAGLKGGDFFMTLKFPITDSLGQGSLGDFEFDVQLTYRTCPGEVQIGTFEAGVNEPVLLQRGWNIILMSSYQSVNIPAASYAATDRLFGNNGTYRYTATNA
jgi:hypothetical protein